MTLSKCVNFIHFGLKIFEIIIDYFIIRINRVIETHSFYNLKEVQRRHAVAFRFIQNFGKSCQFSMGLIASEASNAKAMYSFYEHKYQIKVASVSNQEVKLSLLTFCICRVFGLYKIQILLQSMRCKSKLCLKLQGFFLNQTIPDCFSFFG